MAGILEYTGIAFITAFIVIDLAHRYRRYETTLFRRLRAGIVTVANFFPATAVALT